VAIAELTVIGILSAIGTIIEQDKPYEFYVQNYPNVGPKVLGFVTYDLIWALQWDHIYAADYFWMILGLLAASLAACTATTQWPQLKVAQRWRFRTKETAFAKLPVAQLLPDARLEDVGKALAERRYQVFIKDGALYAFKGLGGKVGPIGVHASMLAALAGITLGTLGGWHGTVMIPEGTAAPVEGALRPATPLAMMPGGGASLLRVDDFRIDYRSDGSVKQFLTDIAGG
jgi:cytochrome c biogenesis protein